MTDETRRLTREQIEEFYAEWAGDVPATPRPDAQLRALCDMALRSEGREGYVMEDGLLTADEMKWLIRFNDCCEDFDADGYDVPVANMERLAKIGAVRKIRGSVYETTELGAKIIERNFALTAPPAPEREGGEA